MEILVLAALVIMAAGTLGLAYFYLSGNILFKIIPYTIILLVSLAVVNTVDHYRGWPLYTETVSGQLLSARVSEKEERIFVWVDEPASVYENWLYVHNILHTDTASGRLFEIEYTQNRADQINQAIRDINDGKIVMIRIIEPGKGSSGTGQGISGEGIGGSGGNGQSAGGSTGGGQGDDTPVLEIDVEIPTALTKD